MSWFKNLFGVGPDRRPEDLHGAGRSVGSRDLERAVRSAREMLSVLMEAYGHDSVIVRQQKSYLETLQRELAAARAA